MSHRPIKADPSTAADATPAVEAAVATEVEAGAMPQTAPVDPDAPQYDCLKCPGYCCSYPVIAVTRRDVTRLAKHFGITNDEAKRRYTKAAHGHELVLRRKPDTHFGRICKMFDTQARRCTVYQARPAICRKFPNEPHCGYYDFLSFERRHQKDPEFIAKTDSSEWS